MIIPKRLQKLSNKDNGTLVERALKLCEEAGEVAQASLRISGRKSSRGKNHKELRMDVVEECVDVAIMAMDVLTHLKYTNSREIERLINRKLKKWQKSVAKDPRQNCTSNSATD
jgi:NTP pyrophosphatase (non-canonical NTP hydrolase)